MNRINVRQFAAMLLIGDVFSLLCLGGEVTVITAAGFTGAAAIELLLLLPFALYYRSGRRPGRLAGALLLVFTALWIFGIFRMLWRISDVIYVPSENGGGIYGKAAVTGLIVLVCAYSVSAGVKALGRASMIAASLGALCILIVTLYSLRHHDWESLSRTGRDLSAEGELLRGLRAGGGIAGAAVLLGMTSGDHVRNVCVYAALKAVVTAAVLITSILILGGIMPMAEYPVLMAVQLSQPFPSQRIDALFLTAFSVYAVFTAAVQSAAAAYLIKDLTSVRAVRRRFCGA